MTWEAARNESSRRDCNLIRNQTRLKRKGARSVLTQYEQVLQIPETRVVYDLNGSNKPGSRGQPPWNLPPGSCFTTWEHALNNPEIRLASSFNYPLLSGSRSCYGAGEISSDDGHCSANWNDIWMTCSGILTLMRAYGEVHCPCKWNSILNYPPGEVSFLSEVCWKGHRKYTDRKWPYLPQILFQTFNQFGRLDQNYVKNFPLNFSNYMFPIN